MCRRGAPFFVAEWIAGGRCDARRWDDPRALWSLLADVAGALAVIHAAGLVHGDVAPANILLVEAIRERLTRSARACSSTSGSRRRSGARGTPQYMAPEALAGLVEPRSDLYGARRGRGRSSSPASRRSMRRRSASSCTGSSTRAAACPARRAAPLADLIAPAHRARSRRAAGIGARRARRARPARARDRAGLARRARPKVGAPPRGHDVARRRAVRSRRSRAGSRTPAVHVVVGGAGSGARQLVDARRAALAARRGRARRDARRSRPGTLTIAADSRRRAASSDALAARPRAR